MCDLTRLRTTGDSFARIVCDAILLPGAAGGALLARRGREREPSPGALSGAREGAGRGESKVDHYSSDAGAGVHFVCGCM